MTTRCCFLVVFLGVASFAAAQDSADTSTSSTSPIGTANRGTETEAEQAPAQQSVDELRRRVDILAAEVEKLRSGEPDTVELSQERQRALGLAPSAAATYRRRDEGV